VSIVPATRRRVAPDLTFAPPRTFHLCMSLPPFQTLIDEHGRAVRRFLAARVGAVDADDLWQETFLSALRAYPQLDDDRHLRAWLMTIAHRKTIDHVRARGRRAVPNEAAPELVAADGGDPAADPGLDPIWAEVAALPDKQRTAVALRFLGDLSHAEIATAMRISEAAARRNVHEGVNRLRRERVR
jgi:RNA polymerase sigma factor (sigma-70 family)